jgi:hypothetical protein
MTINLQGIAVFTQDIKLKSVHKNEIKIIKNA